MSRGDLRGNLAKCIDKVLEVKDNLGAIKALVDIVTRTWSGQRPGDGSFKDVLKPIKPTPCIKDFSHDIRLQAGANYKAGDLILTSISRNKFPDENELLTVTDKDNVEKFIKVGPHYYTAISINEKFVTWNLHIRKTVQDETERR